MKGLQLLSSLEISELDNDIRKSNLMTACDIRQNSDHNRLDITIFTHSEKNDLQIRELIQELAECKFNLKPESFEVNFERFNAPHISTFDNGTPPRPHFTGLSFEISDERTQAKVGLAFKGNFIEGLASNQGRNTTTSARMFAEATLMAVSNIISATDLFSLRDVVIQPYGDRQIVLVLVEVVTSGWKGDLTGSCIVKNNEEIKEAVVKATLASINRIFPKLIADFS